MVGTIKKILFGGLLVLGIILGGGINGACPTDKDPSYVPNWDDTTWTMDVDAYKDHFSYPRVVARGVVEALYPAWDREAGKQYWKKSQAEFQQMGSAFVVKEGFAITAAHVVTPMQVGVNMDSISTYQTTPFKLVSRTILLYDHKSTAIVADLWYINLEMDVAILKFKNTESLKPMPYEIFVPVNVVGTRVAAIVHKRDADGNLLSDVEVKYGIMSSPDIDEVVPREDLPWFNIWDFSIGIVNVQPGDSGSPLFMMMNGKPMVVGIVRALYDTTPSDGVCEAAFAARFYWLKRYLEFEE